MRWISLVRNLYFKSFSSCFLFTFLSAGIATSIDMHVSCFSSRIVISGLLLRYFCQLALFVPYYGNLTFSNSLYQFPYIAIQLLVVQFPPISLHVIQRSSAVLFFCQYWTCWYDLFHCLIKLFTVYSCPLFLFVIFLLNDIWFLVLPLFQFQSLLSDLPSTAIVTFFSTNKLSIHTSNVPAMQHFAIPCFL